MTTNVEPKQSANKCSVAARILKKQCVCLFTLEFLNNWII